MKTKIKAILCGLLIANCVPVFAQSHISIPLDDKIYYILEQAEARGLCRPLPGARPYTQNTAVIAIREIIDSADGDKLTPAELEILSDYLKKYAVPETGFDLSRGAFYDEITITGDTTISGNAGVRAEIEGSTGLFLNNKYYFGAEIWVQAYLNGNIGSNVSYGFSAEGGLIRAPRNKLGEYNIYYEGFDNTINPEYQNDLITVFSEPLTHFPYTYKKRWDGSVFFLDDLTGFDGWPNGFAGGYNLLSELTASFLDNKLLLRLGRLSHDWGSAPNGSSLILNQMARPFLAVEAEFNPAPWFSISSMTGILEYYNRGGYGIKLDSSTFQNIYSITMLQLKYKNYVFFDFMDAVVWPKRLDFGYASPITNSFFYQNNIGDFDNMAIGAVLKLQYPGLGNIWGSLFIDEMDIRSNLFELDRQMLAIQAGLTLYLPFLSFSSLKLSYTINNPYNYTHNRNFNPWYGNELRMETSYTNNGASLGHYLPPNSDELLLRFETMPAKSFNTNFQYQMIRHGADFGDSAVDGSNLLSELDPEDRNEKEILKRFFLRDGAYQWAHIIKIGAEWNLNGAPITFFGEAGAVISYFTNIEEKANITGKAHPYSIIDTPEYPKATSFIIKLGVKIFPQ